MTKPETEKLLPCPFCGGEAERIDFGPGSGDNEGGSCIACKRCQSSGPVEFGYKENFVSTWNSRAQGGGATPDAAPDADWYRRNIAQEPDDVMAGARPIGAPTQCWVLVKDGDMRMVFDSTQSAEEMQESFGGEIYHMVRAPGVTDEMVNRFLTWKLPLSVSADQCATIPNYVERTGTNLLTAVEARAMLEHVWIAAHARSAGGEG